MPPEGAYRYSKKELIPKLIIILLFSIAAHENVDLLREILIAGITLESLTLPLVFFFIFLRFLVGNILHMKNISGLSGLTWITDFTVIIGEAFLIIVMGITTYGLNKFFIIFLSLLFILDFFWIMLMCRQREEREKQKLKIPRLWGWLNLLAFIYLLGQKTFPLFEVSLRNYVAISSIVICIPIAIISGRKAYKEFRSLKSLKKWLLIGFTVIYVCLIEFHLIGSLTLSVHFFWADLKYVLMILVFLSSAVIDLGTDYYDLFERASPKIQKWRKSTMNRFMKEAINEAKKSQEENGIPIGSVLVKNDKIIGRGHNSRVQEDNPIGHAEMNCLRNAGRIRSYKETTLYSTLMPCSMCAGAIVLFGIKKVVVGESKTFRGTPEFMEKQGVKIVDLDIEECKNLMQKFIEDNPQLWEEDIGYP